MTGDASDPVESHSAEALSGARAALRDAAVRLSREALASMAQLGLRRVLELTLVGLCLDGKLGSDAARPLVRTEDGRWLDMIESFTNHMGDEILARAEESRDDPGRPYSRMKAADKRRWDAREQVERAAAEFLGSRPIGVRHCLARLPDFLQ